MRSPKCWCLASLNPGRKGKWREANDLASSGHLYASPSLAVKQMACLYPRQSHFLLHLIRVVKERVIPGGGGGNSNQLHRLNPGRKGKGDSSHIINK